MKSVDFFSGAGGLTCGLQMAGFESILGSAIHPVYAETFAKNNPKTHVVTDDIRELSEYDILELTGLKPGELDLISGGHPVRDFQSTRPLERWTTSAITCSRSICESPTFFIQEQY